jgi:hypothetical protein
MGETLQMTSGTLSVFASLRFSHAKGRAAVVGELREEHWDRSKTVANAKGSDSRSPYVTDYVGRGERIRTSDLLVPNHPGEESPQVSADLSPSTDKKKPDDETR